MTIIELWNTTVNPASAVTALTIFDSEISVFRTRRLVIRPEPDVAQSGSFFERGTLVGIYLRRFYRANLRSQNQQFGQNLMWMLGHYSHLQLGAATQFKAFDRIWPFRLWD